MTLDATMRSAQDWQARFTFSDALADHKAEDIRTLASFDYDRLAEEFDQLAREAVARDAAGISIPVSTRWFIDNRHVVAETFRHLRRDLGAKYRNVLPRLTLPDGTRLPRVLALAVWCLRTRGLDLRTASLSDCITIAQQDAPLTIGELWAFPSMLRYGLLTEAVRLLRADQVAAAQREQADTLARSFVPQKDGSTADLDAVFRAAPSVAPMLAAQLVYRAHSGLDETRQLSDRISAWLAAHQMSAAALVDAEQKRQTGANVEAEQLILSLRRIDEIDWQDWFEANSLVEKILREDPDYTRLTARTRNAVRSRIEALARHSSLSETDVADRAIAASVRGQTQVAALTVGPGARSFARLCGYRAPLRERLANTLQDAGVGGAVCVFGGLLALVAVIAFGALDHGHSPAVFLLLAVALPVLAEPALAVMRLVGARLLPTTLLPSYDFSKGIPTESRTLVVVPCILSSLDTIDDLLRNLEVHYLANPDPMIEFALLGDFVDAPHERMPQDAELLAYARGGIAKLAARYTHTGRRFYLLMRRRQWNPAENVWMGWERKRGKLAELNALLRATSQTSFLPAGPRPPAGVRYVVTLDADTRMPRDTVQRLVGIMAHPVNRPVYDPDERRVVRGHGLIQPSVSSLLASSAESSPFQRIFTQDAGLDPYVFAVSDLYQDLFDEGTYTGKGIYDVDAFIQAAENGVPENAVLSHDLIEGAWLRAGLATDVRFIEDYPTRYDVDLSRQHRWARGDWQLLPFLFDRKNGLNALARVRILDNLRRSIVPICLALSGLLALLFLPAVDAVLWLGLLCGAIGFAQIFGWLSGLVPRQDGVSLRYHVAARAADFAGQITAIVLRMTLMPQLAWSMTDAIARSLWRTYVSHHRMLEWRSADSVARTDDGSLSRYTQIMFGGVLLSTIAVVLVFLFNRDSLLPALALQLIWIAAPAVAWLSAKSDHRDVAEALSNNQKNALRAEGRLTWRFFETFVNAQTHHLPPDNFQTDPEPKLAQRTSPTNIGLYLLSVVTARQFHWITLGEALDRIGSTLTTIEAMPTYRGHLFNWYATDTLEPMGACYVSTVDSGNLAGHLVALSATLRGWAENPALQLLPDDAGVTDILHLMQKMHADIPRRRAKLAPLRDRITEQIDALGAATSQDLPFQTAPLPGSTLLGAASDLLFLIRALEAELKTPTVHDLAWWGERLVSTCRQMEAASVVNEAVAGETAQRMIALADRARGFAFAMDFRFLMDPDRQILSIGYNCDAEMRDNSFYDLLASEARLASIFAIAKGDLSVEHWKRLSRPITLVGGRAALVSWSGCMFEYLMAPLVMDEPEGSILHSSCLAAITSQIGEGVRHGRPWGVSESAYNIRDGQMNYQYFAFGDPAVALRRRLRDDQVVAPYASFLAVMFAPRAAMANLDALETIGARSTYGFHDAVDFTPARLPEGENLAVVRNYMAHHQGMSLVAIGNCLSKGMHRRAFHADAAIEAVSFLLQEPAPREVTPLRRAEEPKFILDGQQDDFRREALEIQNASSAAHAISVMSNGRQSMLVAASGASRVRRDAVALTRWRRDPANDDWGSFIFLRDVETGDWWSTTPAPSMDPAISYSARLFDYKAAFTALGRGVQCDTEYLQSADDDAFAIRIKLRNLTGQRREIELVSFAEIVLGNEADDLAHTVFSKMFVATDLDIAEARIFARRNKRNPSDADLHLLHVATGDGEPAGGQCDRRLFVGRGRSLRNPLAAETPGILQDAHQGESFTLDPIYSLSRRLVLRPGKEAVVTFWTALGDNRDMLDALKRKFSEDQAYEHAHHVAWTRSQIQLHQVGTNPEEAALFRRFGALLVYPNQVLSDPTGAHQPGPQSELWSMSVSGDHPIMVVRIASDDGLPVAREAIRMYEYLLLRGLRCDLVLLNEQPAGYAANLQQSLNSLCQSVQFMHVRPSVFAVDGTAISPPARNALLAAARVVINAADGSLKHQFDGLAQGVLGQGVLRLGIASPRPQPRQFPTRRSDFPGEPLQFWNGTGGFDAAGDYVVRLRHGETTPNPWINVVARTDFGFHISAEGAGYSWSRNSRDHQLTPWGNDPVANTPGEGIFIRDVGSGVVHTPYAGLSSQRSALYECRHGLGYSEFRAWSGALEITAVHSMAPDRALRAITVTVANTGEDAVVLDVCAFMVPVMGGAREATAAHLCPVYQADQRAILCTNPYSVDYAGATMRFSCDKDVSGVALSRLVWLGRNRDLALPAWFDSSLSGRFVHVTDDDPLMMLETRQTVAAGERVTVTYHVLADDPVAQATGAMDLPSAPQLCCAQHTDWQDVLGALKVETPDPAFDLMVNRWLPYQAISCRIRARTAFWQASGAYGFRDQLQDSLAMMIYDPTLARAQIVEAASRQFRQGDVQHWWLPGSGAGVRTTIADDVVWLGAAVARYTTLTGDRALLDVPLPFLEGRELAPGEHDAFYTPTRSVDAVPLYDHAALALDLAIQRSGPNGLPLFLGGDWNDGMNRVGVGGVGESVWLGWFLALTIEDFAPIAEARGDTERAAGWRAHRAQLTQALNATAWDGAWYLRGRFDDGTPLGSHLSQECQIDSIAQSWSVLSGAGEPALQTRAMDGVLAHLLDDKGKILRLFSPPFQTAAADPGYIKAYPPGVRENGGQYTHAAIWTVQALCRAGRAADAWRVFSLLNPVNHARTPEDVHRYRGEPYVVAADVYGAEDKIGRAGWTWYTGSAGWMHRVAVEDILGIRVKDGTRLDVKPVLPPDWPGYRAQVKVAGQLRHVTVTRRDAGPPDVQID